MTKVVILTGWTIAGSIVLFIIILLAIPVVMTFEYEDDIRLKIRYLFITLYSIPKKPKKPKKEKAKKQKPDKAVKADGKTGLPSKKPDGTAAKSQSDDSPEEVASDKDKKKKEKGPKEKNPNNPTLPELIELIKVVLDSLGKPLKKLLKRTSVCDLDVEIICGGEDAAAAALNFGRMNLLIGNALGLLDTFFKLKRPNVRIDVAFDSEETVTRCFCIVKMNTLTALAFVFTFLGRLIVRAWKNSSVMAYISRIRGNSADRKADKKSRKKIAKKIRKDKNK